MIPVALFWFGWTAERTHWIVPILASALFGFGLMLALLPIQLYIVDVFSQYAASALAATALMRSLLGFAIPLFAPQMIGALGLGGTYSLLGGLSILFLPRRATEREDEDDPVIALPASKGGT